MSEPVHLWLKCKAPSLNEINGARYLAGRGRSGRERWWGRYQSGRNRWQEFLDKAWSDERADGPRKVTFTRIMGPRERPYDDDNLIGGLKSLRDYLVDCRFITGDSPEHATFVYKQERGKESAIDILIERY